MQLRAENIERFEALLRNAPAKANASAASAIKRAADSARTQAGRSARLTYEIKHGDVIKTIKMTRPRPSNLTAEIKSTGPVVKLLSFKVNPRTPRRRMKKAIRVSVKKGSNRTFDHGFVAKMGSGHANVFTRTTKKRLPIKGRYGPSVPQMLGNESVIRQIEDRATEVLDNRLEHEFNRLLRG